MTFPRFETHRVIKRPLNGDLRWFVEDRRWWRPTWVRVKETQIIGYVKKQEALNVAMSMADREIEYVNAATIMAERLK